MNESISPKLIKEIKDFIFSYPARAPNEGAKHFGIETKDYNKYYRQKMGKTYKQFMASIPKGSVILITGAVKNGLETFNDYVINWSTKTIVTFVYGKEIIMSFNMHSALQRDYVHQGGGETAPMIAMTYDFPDAKHVYRYAKIHNFTKQSVIVSDIEILSGVTEEDVQTRMLQAFKRKTWQKSEKKKWNEIVRGYNKWADFNSGVLKPFENYVNDVWRNYKTPRIGKIKFKQKEKLALVHGLCDAHYMRLCFSHTGVVVYNKKIARERIESHVRESIIKAGTYCTIDAVFLTVGNDNIHVDNSAHTTTYGTSQTAQTDGTYALDVDTYVDITLDYIECFLQIGVPVHIINVWGNHDEKTSQLLGIFLSKFYQRRSNAIVYNEMHPRVYAQYGFNGLIFTHSTGWPTAKLERDIHKLILSEAKPRGISMDTIARWMLFTYHNHAEHMQELNGFVRHFSAPSLSANEWFDDSWHTDKGYIGREPETANYLISKAYGREAVFYVR